MQDSVVLAVTGASGACYARRILQLLLAQQVTVHLVMSNAGKRVVHEELDCPATVAGLAGCNEDDPRLSSVVLHQGQNIGACIASGSFVHQGMIVAPCSGHSLAAMAHGLADNLVLRAAAVTLKERRCLILLHRETPLTLIDIRNMETLTLAGAVVMPANPGLYSRPQSVEEIVDGVAARALDMLGLSKHGLPVRWNGKSTQS